MPDVEMEMCLDEYRYEATFLSHTSPVGKFEISLILINTSLAGVKAKDSMMEA